MELSSIDNIGKWFIDKLSVKSLLKLPNSKQNVDQNLILFVVFNETTKWKIIIIRSWFVFRLE